MSSWRRSSSVTRPRSNCCWTFAACFSNSARICTLSGGVVTSSMETVTPERVAQWKPASLRASSDAATSTLV
jgi:hypothetical protein